MQNRPRDRMVRGRFPLGAVFRDPQVGGRCPPRDGYPCVSRSAALGRPRRDAPPGRLHEDSDHAGGREPPPHPTHPVPLRKRS
jgi:hypothetical protein